MYVTCYDLITVIKTNKFDIHTHERLLSGGIELAHGKSIRS